MRTTETVLLFADSAPIAPALPVPTAADWQDAVVQLPAVEPPPPVAVALPLRVSCNPEKCCQ